VAQSWEECIARLTETGFLEPSRPQLPPVANDGPHLGRSISCAGYFALAFGAVVGSGWVVVLSDWLRTAGPAGTMIGFVAGGLMMMLIAVCYGELAARAPSAGCEFLYALEAFGARAGFMTGWFLTLYAAAVCAFEAIACAWLLRTLVPGIALPTVYVIASSPVTLDAIVIGIVGAVAIGALHYRGARTAIGFQNIVTYGFILVCLGLIACGLSLGSVANLRPFWQTASGNSWLMGSLTIFPVCAFFLNGWQTALHAIEERRSDVPPRLAVMSMVFAIFAASVFYIGITAAAASALPWMQLVGRDLAAAAAFQSLGLHGILGTVVLVVAAISLTKTWSALVWVGSRLMFAQARYGLLPASFLKVDSATGAPRPAIVVISILTIIGVLLGRGAITPIVNMVSICLALSIIFCLTALLKLRRSGIPSPSFSVPGGTPVIVLALIGGIVMIGLAVIQPVLRGGRGVPLEWILLISWAALGLVVWTVTQRFRHE
jgi:APA family basic amino acid/polyamine antiporter